MLIKRRRDWEIPEAEATDEAVFLNRRHLLKSAAAGVAAAMGGAALSPQGAEAAAGPPEGDPSINLYPVARNDSFALDRPLTDEAVFARYTNYYEFGTSKSIWREARNLPVRPWTVVIDGLVEQERQIDIDDLLAQVELEERLYRLRCVEAWSMAVPWTGFPMRALVELARPLASARYVRMETFNDPEVAPGQRAGWYPWPYIEALTIEEATNELAFLGTGAYGQPLAQQNGSPLRLVVPWKYGFKSIKGIVRFTFTEEMPTTFWWDVQGAEYGFWANVNPEIDHPRWSQAEEQFIRTESDVGFLARPERRPTLLYNGYGDFVAHMYAGLEERYGDRLFR
ncbi:MAG: protein-methionine-sulfoxide reductase catalytic subunit MsrP [Pararhodobacter sp.]|nr:protein-methionine-sulfoxide reductase catalytic subunit MsrP [Pararhodobacter sp.]